MSPTRDEAMTGAAQAYAEADLAVRRGTVTDAAKRSYGYLSGRRSLEETELRIAQIRARGYDAVGQQVPVNIADDVERCRQVLAAGARTMVGGDKTSG